MVRFHKHADDSLLRFAVICAQYQNQWLLVRHRERHTWECPGGHREPGEDIDAAARRELWEETAPFTSDCNRYVPTLSPPRIQRPTGCCIGPKLTR